MATDGTVLLLTVALAIAFVGGFLAGTSRRHNVPKLRNLCSPYLHLEMRRKLGVGYLVDLEVHDLNRPIYTHTVHAKQLSAALDHAIDFIREAAGRQEQAS